MANEILRIETAVPMASHTTLHVGGPADFFVSVHTIEELREAVAYARQHALPITILGGGSNMLVADSGVRGIVIKNEIGGVTYEDRDYGALVISGAGVVFDELIAETVVRGLWGLENLSAIPGSVGATPIQNVGAYGVEVADRILWVEVYDTEGDQVLQFEKDECAFGYRDSRFKRAEGKRYIVTRVAYVLSREPQPIFSYRDLAERFASTLQVGQRDIREAVIEIRKKKFPDWHVVGTAGSFFKNPTISKAEFEALRERYLELPGYETTSGRVKLALGYVLDKICHVRGYRKGAVGTYEGQALVVVNHGGATAEEIDQFAEEIAACVYDAIGVHVEREVVHVA